MSAEFNVPVFQPARAEYDRAHADRALDDIYRTLTQLRDAVVGLPDIRSGNGSPAGQVVANPGALFLRLDGGTGTTLYIKETGTGASGWVAK